jgi:hypothetical protein
MNKKRIVARYLWIMLFPLLAACGAAPTKAVDNTAATQIVATFMAQITQTAVAANTSTPTDAAPAADETEEPDIFDELETSEASDDLDLTATPGASQALLSRFRFVTLSDGNLYVRDGMGLPVQITKSGTDHDPVISSDGQKIVFYRGEGSAEVFGINADGSGEKALINKTITPNITISKILSPTFRPGTHQLIFATYSCEQSKCQIGVFMTETEAHTITELANGLPVQRNLDGVFTVSPDGHYLVVKNSDQLDLYSMDGRIMQTNIAGGPAYGGAYWLPNSRDLIVLSTWLGNYTIWHYDLKEKLAKQISIDRQPVFNEDIACYLSISPDRNWVFYQDDDQRKRLGNLKDMQTEIYAWDGDCNVHWSPNSQHFASQTTIGSVDGTPPIAIDGHFIAWLDGTHYLFTKGTSILDLQNYITEVGHEANAAPTNFTWSPVYAVISDADDGP